jgi:hypothetical protein
LTRGIVTWPKLDGGAAKSAPDNPEKMVAAAQNRPRHAHLKSASVDANVVFLDAGEHARL